MAQLSREELQQRQALFTALTGNAGAQVSGTSSDVRGMLSTVYGTVRNGQPAVDTREAAKRLGVSQRTVQRWIKGENAPAPERLKTIQKKSRQAATTKRGRARAVKRATTSSKFVTEGVRVRVAGDQGPAGYSRDRSAAQKLSPEEYQELLEAFAEGGEAGALEFLQSVMSEKYVDNWQFNRVNDFRIDGLAAIDREDPRAL